MIQNWLTKEDGIFLRRLGGQMKRDKFVTSVNNKNKNVIPARGIKPETLGFRGPMLLAELGYLGCSISSNMTYVLHTNCK